MSDQLARTLPGSPSSPSGAPVRAVAASTATPKACPGADYGSPPSAFATSVPSPDPIPTRPRGLPRLRHLPGLLPARGSAGPRPLDSSGANALPPSPIAGNAPHSPSQGPARPETPPLRSIPFFHPRPLPRRRWSQIEPNGAKWSEKRNFFSPRRLDSTGRAQGCQQPSSFATPMVAAACFPETRMLLFGFRISTFLRISGIRISPGGHTPPAPDPWRIHERPR